MRPAARRAQIFLALVIAAIPGCLGGDQPVLLSEPALRHHEPLSTVIADLDAFIPEGMARSGVPGLSIALVWDGQVAWEGGYGVMDTLTRAPVTPETIFEAASLGKVVAAYLALRLVQEQRLDLDQPLDGYLSESWLPAASYPEEISLAQVLSHTSGLSNDANGRDRSVAFPPGTRFSYSGAGWRYLQEVVTVQSGSGVEQLAGEMVFEPLGMTETSFERPPGGERIASGHLPAGQPMAIFAVLLGAILAGLVLALSLYARLRTGGWKIRAAWVAALFLLSALGATAVVIAIFGRTFTAAILRAGWMGTAVVVVFLFSGYTLRGIGQALGRMVWPYGSAAAVVTALLVTGQAQMPIQRRAIRTNYAFSLHSTAADMAALLVELSHPELLSTELWRQMQIPQVRVNEHISWGLGIGIQHGAEADSLWHWGANPGYQSLMVIYPQQGIGVVVLTNSSEGLPLAREIAQRALGGKAYWDIAP